MNIGLKQLNPSVVIALVAVLISLSSTFISYQETQILRQQQRTLAEQKVASVWPYVENIPFLEFKGDSLANFHYKVFNKGVGPAIIGNVTYSFQAEEHRNWELYKLLKAKYPKFEISQIGNADISNTVIAAGEELSVIRLSFLYPNKELLSDVMNEVVDTYILKFCYNSIYGDS